MRRYSTIDDSLKGHNEIVDTFRIKGFKVIKEVSNFESEIKEFTRFEIMDI